MYSTLRVTTLTSPALFVIFLYIVFKSVCTLVWAFPTFPVDTSGVNRFQTSGTLLLRFVVSSRMVTLSDLCLFPPQWAVLLHPCWQADLFALWPGYGWGIGGSTQVNTFLCPTLKWLSSDINFLSLLDSVHEYCSLQMRCTHSIFPFPGVNKINNSYILTGMVPARSAEVSEILVWCLQSEEPETLFYELVSCLHTVCWNLNGSLNDRFKMLYIANHFLCHPNASHVKCTEDLTWSWFQQCLLI